MAGYQFVRRLKMAARAMLVDTPLLPSPRPRRDEDEGNERAPLSPPPPDAILEIGACPMCGHGEVPLQPDRAAQDHGRTVVCEYNRFITFERQPDARAARYDYAVCHACGVLYATRRPAGKRLRWLLEHFEETLARDPGRRNLGSLTGSSFALTASEQDELRRRAARGVFVSEHLGVSRREYLPGLLSDRLANSIHVDLLGALLELKAPRVLEIRCRAGSTLAALRRLYGADVHAMALFENQRFIIEAAHRIPATAPIDYTDFSIPCEGTFDLILANHMLTHSVRPRDFLRTVRDRLTPGGHLYLYNEPDDAEFLSDGKSMFNTLNAFHLQAFDRPSFTRALAANGFDIVFLTRHDRNFLCLAKKADVAGAWQAMDDAERTRRIDQHRKARDAAILMLPRHARTPFAREWDQVVERAFAAGTAEIGEDGRPRVRRP